MIASYKCRLIYDKTLRNPYQYLVWGSALDNDISNIFIVIGYELQYLRDILIYPGSDNAIDGSVTKCPVIYV